MHKNIPILHGKKVGLYQEGEEPRENAWSPLLLLDQPFSFLKISSKYNSTRELDLSSQASQASGAKPAAGSSALQLVGA